jgi:molecular chaperone Hsp33
MKDYLVKAYAFDGTVRIYAAKTTDLVEEARQIHDTWPAATAALGKALTGTIIMGAMYKGDQSLTIRFDGSGPIGGIVTTTNAMGEVRGYVGNPHIHASTNDDKLADAYAVGDNGFIHVTKDLKVRNIFTSSSEMRTGEIAQDLAYYFTMSEQIPSAVGLGVLINEKNETQSAGGFILQVMPGAKSDALDEIERNIQAMKPVSELIKTDYTPEMIINEITKGKPEFIETMSLKYACDCSKDRFARGIISLGKTEIKQLIEEKKPIETVCHFCNKKYVYNEDELTSFLESAK